MRSIIKRSIIKQIFGNDKERKRVIEEDIRKLIEWKEKETINLEYKSTQNLQIKNGKLIEKNKLEDKTEELLIKPLVAFLNKYQSDGGLLIWGIYTKDEIPIEVRTFQKGTVKKEDIERLIKNNILSIPPSKNLPLIEIEEVEIKEGKTVFLIEIHPKDFNTVYYSKITNKVYIRKWNHSEEIPLVDVYKLIEERINAKLFIIPTVRKVSLENKRIEIELQYLNEGYKPAERVKSILNIKVSGKSKYLKINVSPPLINQLRCSSIECGVEKTIMIIEKYFNEVIYPFIPHKIGDLYLEEYDINSSIVIRIVNCEYRGVSEQKYEIIDGKLNEKEKKFDAYYWQNLNRNIIISKP